MYNVACLFFNPENNFLESDAKHVADILEVSLLVTWYLNELVPCRIMKVPFIVKVRIIGARTNQYNYVYVKASRPLYMLVLFYLFVIVGPCISPHFNSRTMLR